MHALTGDLAAIDEHNWYWKYILNSGSDSEIFFTGAYITMYFAGPRVGRALLDAYHKGDERELRRLLSLNGRSLRNKLIKESYENLKEPWYKNNIDWAETNFLREHVGMKVVGKYHKLSPNEAGQVIAVAKHARRKCRDSYVDKVAGGVIGSLESLGF
jgi:hypothetical protein